jgi:CRISPR-associated helicase Cas3
MVEKDYGFHREPPAEIYCGLAVITTLDSFSARLFPSKLTKWKYIDLVRGKLLRAYLVFDEIHSYELYTLGFIRGLLQFLAKVEIPHVVMTATLNKNQQRFLGINSGYSILERGVSRECCKVDMRGDMIYDGSNEKLAKIVLSILEEVSNESDLNSSRILIVCNTVTKAQYVYEQIKKTFGSKVNLEIIHSRFTGEDRKIKVSRACGLLRRKYQDFPSQGGVVISTQVIESGTDVSADYIITEIAPPDALVQRIGRCARELRVPNPEQKGNVKLGKVFIIPIEVGTHSRDNIHMKPYPWYWILCSQALLTDLKKDTENVILNGLISITPAIRSDFKAITVQYREENLDFVKFLDDSFGITAFCDSSDFKTLLNEAKEGYEEFDTWLRFRMHAAKPSLVPKVRENERYMILVYAIDEVKDIILKINEAIAESDYSELRKLRKNLKEIEEKYVVPVDARVLEHLRSHLIPIGGIGIFQLPQNMYAYDGEKGLTIAGGH